MLKFEDDGVFVKLEFSLPKYNPKAVWVDFANYRNDQLISFTEMLAELESFSRVYGECEIKYVDILLKEDLGDYILKNNWGLNFKSYVNYLNEHYNTFGLTVEKCFIELIKPIIYQTNDEVKNDVKELYKEVDIIYNELELLRKKSRKKNKSKRRLISGKKRLAVFERDGHRCQYCGATVEDGAKLHIDHILPVSKGGTNNMWNLQVLCQKCNLAKHNDETIAHDKKKLKELQELYGK